jgi:hypothetical protein
MRRLAGFVFDAYDDVDGQVLRATVPDANTVPDFVKTAARLTSDQINGLPDDRFALVLLDEGRKFKKYACVDKGNTALSVMYLLKQAHLLPPEAVKVAAGNLIGACENHGLDVPSHLKIAAKTGISPVSGRSQPLYAKNVKVSKVQFPGTEVPKESTTNPRLGQHDAGLDDLKDRTNAGGTQGNNTMALPVFSQKEKEKTASWWMANKGEEYADAMKDPKLVALHEKHNRDFNHPEVHKRLWELTEGKKDKKKEKTAAPEGASVITKQKSWRQVPYVDITNWDPGQATGEDTKSPEMTLLEGRFPIDGYDQVKTASVYFDEVKHDFRGFPPRQRHEYCVKLASRMAELGMEIPEDVARYAEVTFTTSSCRLSMSFSRNGPRSLPALLPRLSASSTPSLVSSGNGAREWPIRGTRPSAPLSRRSRPRTGFSMMVVPASTKKI